LFDQDQFSADQFNQLVEGGMRVITDLLEANMSKEQLEEYLQVKVSGRDETRKVILQFWK
jgi:hypothetical protein